MLSRKQACTWALSFLVALLLAANSATFAAPQKQTSRKEAVVYITKTGKKYHRDGCRYLSRSRIPVKRVEAQKRYDPCSVCRP